MGAKANLKRGALFVAGWAFIILGILGLFLPILQGILFILIGLVILSSVSPWADRLLQRIRKRFPRISNTVDDATRRAKEFQHREAARFERIKTRVRRLRRPAPKRKRRKSAPDARTR